ncbi:MAG: SDR family NAD(P)-dependent oxidoreductase [Nannocystaceae bacterium]|nr:SDR family NAD(P)-dependent oxidoreductase [Myxococcales bacterium]
MDTQRVAVVTGANRGIGRAIAEQLRAAGVRVLGTAREEGASDIALDVTREDQLDALARRVSAGVDILINNAGAAFDGFDEDVARRTLAVNFYGPMRVTDRLLPALRPGGRVVMVSSGMGTLSIVGPALRAELADDGLTRAQLVQRVDSFVASVARGTHRDEGWPSNAYSVSKLALNALTRVLTRELAGDPRGLTVDAVCPGWVRTRMGGDSAPRTPEEGARTPVWLALRPADATAGGSFYRDQQPIPW